MSKPGHKTARKGLEPTRLPPFLGAVLGAFHRRTKAIRYRTQRFDLVLEQEEASVLEGLRLNVDATLRGSQPVLVRLSLWEDAQIWLRACLRQPHRKGRSGWAFNHELRCDVSDLAAPKIVLRFERTLAAAADPQRDPAQSMRAIWPYTDPDSANRLVENGSEARAHRCDRALGALLSDTRRRSTHHEA